MNDEGLNTHDNVKVNDPQLRLLITLKPGTTEREAEQLLAELESPWQAYSHIIERVGHTQ
jgi:hypothetical protein